MSKIIKKKHLSMIIESTLKEYRNPNTPERCYEPECLTDRDCADWCHTLEMDLREEEGETCEVCGETVCECGTSYMGEDLVGNQKVLDKNKNNKVDSEDLEILRSERDSVEESVKDLAESVNKTFNSSLLKEDMDMFNKLINYKNK